jgi:hypothetical protein
VSMWLRRRTAEPGCRWAPPGRLSRTGDTARCSRRPILFLLELLLRVVLGERPCEYRPDRFKLNLGQMRRVRPTDADDLDRVGQPAARPETSGSPSSSQPAAPAHPWLPRCPSKRLDELLDADSARPASALATTGMLALAGALPPFDERSEPRECQVAEPRREVVILVSAV